MITLLALWICVAYKRDADIIFLGTIALDIILIAAVTGAGC